MENGDYNTFNGDAGSVERPDVMLVGNHHAREWMSYEVPMLFLETVAYYYGQAGIDNDGDGLIDEDSWNGVDDDGDCLSLNASFQVRTETACRPDPATWAWIVTSPSSTSPTSSTQGRSALYQY